MLTQQRLPFATRDAHGPAARRRGDRGDRATTSSAPPSCIRAGADVIVIDIAHGHSVVMERAMEQFRQRFGDVELVAGNVATPTGRRFLAERGVNGIKVGIGPGGGCTTRLTTNFGVPQVQALVECRMALGGRGVPIIADGGVQRHGAWSRRCCSAATRVMLGSAFAGTEETPGDVVQKPVLLPESQKSVKVPFKVLRGMASIAGDQGPARRRGRRRRGPRRRIGAEGHRGQRAGARLGRGRSCAT